MATAANTAILYDPRYMDFGHWASLICEQFSAQNVQIPDERTNWQDWAAGLLAVDLFASQNAPQPYEFEEWQDWASAMLNAMNGGS